MDNPRYPIASEQQCTGRRIRRSSSINRAIAGLSWGLGALVCGTTVVFWLRGGPLTAESVITTLIVAVGTGLGGLLALGGEGDVILLTGADEGQRQVIYKAMAPAFNVAYFGLFVIWVGGQLWAPLRLHALDAVGVLLLLLVVVYLIAYLAQRWRA